MPIYTNVNGSQKQLGDVYANVGGSQKELTFVYANIGGSQKEIHGKRYTWNKYNSVGTTYYRWKKYNANSQKTYTYNSNNTFYIDVNGQSEWIHEWDTSSSHWTNAMIFYKNVKPIASTLYTTSLGTQTMQFELVNKKGSLANWSDGLYLEFNDINLSGATYKLGLHSSSFNWSESFQDNPSVAGIAISPTSSYSYPAYMINYNTGGSVGYNGTIYYFYNINAANITTKRLTGVREPTGTSTSYSKGSTSYGTVQSTSSTAYPNNNYQYNSSDKKYYWYVSTTSTTSYSKGTTSYGTVESTNSSAYPTNGRHTDGYWYVLVS